MRAPVSQEHNHPWFPISEVDRDRRTIESEAIEVGGLLADRSILTVLGKDSELTADHGRLHFARRLG